MSGSSEAAVKERTQRCLFEDLWDIGSIPARAFLGGVDEAAGFIGIDLGLRDGVRQIGKFLS